MKKLLSLVLALAMILMVGAAFAADPDTTATGSSITVNGLSAGDNVKYVQVIAWDNTNGWVKANGFSSLSDDVFAEVVGNSTTQGKITDASATAIAAIGATMTNGGSVADGETSWSKSGLNPGLYMVQAVATNADVIYNPVFVAIQADGTNGTVTLPLSYADNGTAKKSTITLDKKAKSQGDTEWQKATTEDVGDIIDYKVETTIPAFLESYTDPVFTVTDQVSSGLTFATGESGALTNLEVKAGETTLVKDTDYEITEQTASKWIISFKNTYLQGITSATVVTIEYKAKITADAKNVNPETNTVTIDYSRNPSDSKDHGTKEDKTKHYTFDIDAGLQGDAEYVTSELIKVAVDENGQPILEEKTYSNKEKHHPLAGAKFQLFTDEECKTYYSNSTITPGYKFETDAMGRMEIKGLDEGTYYLKESDAAPGYMLVTTPVKFVITAHYKDVAATDTCNAYKELDWYEVKVNGETTSHYTIDNGTVTKTTEGTAGDVGTEIENPKGVSLPSTGGIGTTIFYVLGGLLVVGAAVILVARRKAHE